MQALSDGQNLALGCMAGVCAKSCNYPLLVAKNNTQQGLPISWNPRVVYRGLPMAQMNLGGTTAVQFWATGAFQKLIAGKSAITAAQEVQASFLGGLFSGVPCSLWELTMIQQQRFGGTLAGTPMNIVKDYGAMALGRAMSVTCAREAVFTMAMLGICPVLQREIPKAAPQVPNQAALAAGALLVSSGGDALICTTSVTLKEHLYPNQGGRPRAQDQPTTTGAPIE